MADEAAMSGRPCAPPHTAQATDQAQCALRHERRDAVEHRRRILAAARSLFAAHGVDGVTMQQIARAARVGQGTLYRRYAHKGQLCVALLDESVARLQQDVSAARASGAGSASALAQLDVLLARLVAFNEENAPLLHAIADAACGPRRASIYHMPFYRWLQQTVAALLRQAIDAGESRPLDIPCTTDVLLAALAIDLYSYQRREQGLSPERITQALRHLYIDGVRIDPAGQRQQVLVSGR